MQNLQKWRLALALSLGILVFGTSLSAAHAGVASAVPAVIASASLVDDTTAVKGNPLTYSTQVPLSNGTVYFVYLKIQVGTFNGLPNPATVFTSNSAVLQTALQGSTGALSADKSFAVYSLARTTGVVPVNSTIAFAPQGVAGNDGSINHLFAQRGGGVVNAQISIGSSANTSTVLSDIDSAAGGNIIQFDGLGLPDTTCKISVKAGYWWNPAEPGRGYVLEQQSNSLYFGAFMYAAGGRPTWYQASGALVDTTSPTGAICTFNASLNTFANGQVLDGTFKPAAGPTAVGNVSISFFDSSHASIVMPGTTINVQRFPVVAGGFLTGPTALQPQTGFWLNPTEPGRGYGLEIQGNTMYYVAFMYDGSGNPIWYLAGPGSVDAHGTYMGSLALYNGGQTLGGAFQSATVANPNVGAITLQFPTPATGMMTYPGGSQVPLQRYNFLAAGDQPIIAVTLAGNGTSSVSSSPAGIACGATCTQGFAFGSNVTLSPILAPGDSFGGWGGSVCVGATFCTLSMGANTRLVPVFAATGSFPAAVTVTGPGTVTSSPAGINCTQLGGAGCGAAFANGTVVTFTAKANADGSTFSSWSGDCGGTTCQIANGTVLGVRALFKPSTAISDNGGL